MFKLSEEEQLIAGVLTEEIEREDPVFCFDNHGLQEEIVKVWKEGGYGLDGLPAGIVVHGGYRSGKTFVTARIWSEEMTGPDPKVVYFITVDEKQSIEVHQSIMAQMLPKWSYQGGELSYTTERGFVGNQFVLNNGSHGLFKMYTQAEDGGGKQGGRQDGHSYDEELKLDAFKKWQKRLWDYGGRWTLSAVSDKGMTPLLNELHRDAVTVKKRFSELCDEELPVIKVNHRMNVAIFYLWTLDNPHLNHEKILRDAKSMSHSELKVSLHGIPGDLAGLVYPSFDYSLHVIQGLRDSIDVGDNWYFLNIVDPHDDRPWAISWAWLNPVTGALYFIDEWPNFNVKTDDTPNVRTWRSYATTIKAKEKDLLGAKGNKICRVIDPRKGPTKSSGREFSQTVIEGMLELGLNFEPAPVSKGKDFDLGHNAVRELLSIPVQTDPISEENKPRLYFDADLQNTITYMQNYTFDDLEAWKDYPDNVRYATVFSKHLHSGERERSRWKEAEQTARVGGVRRFKSRNTRRRKR